VLIALADGMGRGTVDGGFGSPPNAAAAAAPENVSAQLVLALRRISRFPTLCER